MSPTAILFPENPEALSFDIQAEAAAAASAGLKLYSNGKRFALLPARMIERPAGWYPFGGAIKCAA